MKIFILIHILFVITLFSKNDIDFNHSFMFKPVILAENRNYDNADSSSTIFSVKEKEYLSSFQEQFKDYPFILYLDDIYQNVYRYSSINTVLFQDENNLLSLLSNYDVSCSRIQLSIKYNFK